VPAPTAAPGKGAPPIPTGAKPVYAADGRQIFLSPGASVRVGSRPAGEAASDAASAPSADAAPATPSPAPPVLEPLATVAEPRRETPRLAAEEVGGCLPGGDTTTSVPPLAAAPAAEPVAAPPARVVETPAAEAKLERPFVTGDETDELDRADAANVEIRSEEIDEILSAMPGGLVRWGITAVFGTLLVLLAITWYIKYPDVVNGRIALTTPTPPVRLVARTGGQVERVFASDGARVHAGDPLVLLQSPARYADVQALSSALDRLEPALNGGGPVPDPTLDRALSLGSLQQPYAALQQAYADYRLSRDELFYTQKLNAARQQVADLETMRQRLQAQQTLLEQQLQLGARARDRARMLVDRNLGAAADVDHAEEEYLQKQVAVENGRTSLTSNEVQLSAQRGSLLDLEQRRSDEGERGLVALRNAAHALRAAVATWEQDNLLRAPVDGTVSFFRELHTNQFASAAEPLVAVLPTASGLVGRVQLTGQGAGKVRRGQRVIIRFENFPYREYGTVEGRVERVSQLGFQADSHAPEVTTYQLEVSLPNGLVTTYKRRLEFRQEMRGDVDVVTQDLRLLERLFNKVRATASGG
jgi:HlyD family secretion protein